MATYPKVSRTTHSLTSYVFTALRARVAGHPGPLHRLQIGDTWREPLPEARCETLKTAEHPGLHRYAPVAGLPELVDAIGRKLERTTGVQVPEERLQVVAGATGGLSVTIQALLDPGDEVLLPSPFWPLIRGIISSRGATPIEIPFYDRLGDDSFDPEAALEAAVTPRTAAIYLNSPHNPTGAVLSEDRIAAIARVAERHGLWVLTDEVYEDLWYGDEAPTPLWARDDLGPRSVAVHSVSKAYGLAGARVGYVHGPEEAMRAIRAVQTFQAYCASRPMQLAAARALDLGDDWLAETRGMYRSAMLLSTEKLGLKPTEGGTFVFFDTRRWEPETTDALSFLERCLDAGVVLTPGGASGSAYNTWVRLCYTCVPQDALAEALTALESVLSEAETA